MDKIQATSPSQGDETLSTEDINIAIPVKLWIDGTLATKVAPSQLQTADTFGAAEARSYYWAADEYVDGLIRLDCPVDAASALLDYHVSGWMGLFGTVADNYEITLDTSEAEIRLIEYVCANMALYACADKTSLEANTMLLQMALGWALQNRAKALARVYKERL